MPAAVLFENLKLRQYPPIKQGQPYNSADGLLVEAARASGIPGDQTLVVNDEFGALCTALQARALWTDSWLAKHSLTNNLALNVLDPTEVYWSTDKLPQNLLASTSTLVLMRTPKQLSYFKYQLSVLSRLLPQGSSVLVAGMDKHLAPATAELLETYIGPTHRHRGQRKARLFSALRDSRQPAPYSGTAEYYCEALGSTLISRANVFAREKMDIGSRFLLENLEKLQATGKIIDLACGNGIIGLTALSRGLCEELLFCDESAMALASARTNTQKLFPDRGNINFHHDDGLLNYTGDAAGLILCNPPFHLNHRIDEAVGRRLLVQAAAHLVKGGSLCLVANRHLNYLPVLKREFRQVGMLAQNSKFIIWQATI